MTDTDTTVLPTIICLSHLAWDRGLFQRPQHIMAQISMGGQYRVLFLGCVGRRAVIELDKKGNIRGNGSFRHLTYSPFAHRLEWLRRWLALSEIRKHLPPDGTGVTLWITHPALWPLAQSIPHETLVFDAMDPFTLFEKTDKERYIAYSTQMCRNATAIFTGGHTMHAQLVKQLEAYGQPCDKVHCFPSGIDWEHFSRATLDITPIHPVLDDLPRPVWGYFGALDERIDTELVRELCRRNTGGTVVLAGPVLRVLFPTPPPNLLMPGAIIYGELPQLLKGFDVCLIPFRNTQLVLNLSPTKTPEYLAGGKPVVSTAIPDVEHTWGHIVGIAHNPQEFADLCKNARPLAETEYESAKNIAPAWRTMVEQMLALIHTRGNPND